MSRRARKREKVRERERKCEERNKPGDEERYMNMYIQRCKIRDK